MAYILTEVAESVGTITLDHERRRNALSLPLVEEVITALHSFRDAKVRVVILRAGSGVKVFSAGHDIDEL
ncbi:MAG: enoyl-CoA hydratase-related protein, partial [Microvirga sp.]